MVWFDIIIGISLFIHVAYVIALVKKDNSIMTFMWPVGLLIILFIVYFNQQTDELGLIVLVICATIWGLRLFLQTFVRNMRRGYEDFRYKELRDSSDGNFHLKAYLQFFVIQGIFMMIIGIVFVYPFLINYDTNIYQIIIGTIVFLIGIIIETISDLQLYQFKKHNDKEKILKSGLWSISRHPNYLGEIIVWWGLGLIAFQPSIWWIFVSPLILMILLRFASGVPLVEERYNDNSEYQKYKKNTSTLFPF